MKRAKYSCIGDCGAASNGFGMTCNGIGGQPPATLAEFTLNGYGGSDYYDLSNVDGHTISMTIRPIPGQFTTVNNPSLGKYNCGTVNRQQKYKLNFRMYVLFSFRQVVHLMQVNVHQNCKWMMELAALYALASVLLFTMLSNEQNMLIFKTSTTILIHVR